jgi:Fe-S oxidoreductase
MDNAFFAPTFLSQYPLTHPMTIFFAPGCALMLYKPHLAGKIHEFLVQNIGKIEFLDICCRNHPEFKPGDRIINTCPGCDRRYRHDYDDSITTVSLWEVLDECDCFPFPDCQGQMMTIIDACPTRSETQIHEAVRNLLGRMNIALVEPKNTRANTTCCGDVGWGKVPTEKVRTMMKLKADEMPLDEIVVYCVSCAKSMFIGGRKPRYLVDLLFEEKTVPGIIEPDDWHREIDEYTTTH